MDLSSINQVMAANDDLADTMRKRNNPAGHMLDRLNAHLQIFQKSMAAETEVGIIAVGSVGSFNLRKIRVSNPDMLIFNGIDQDGRKMQLFQHHSQMSVMFVEVPKIEEKPYRVGFTS